jgi:rhodanese-related sulfurtransferase
VYRKSKHKIFLIVGLVLFWFGCSAKLQGPASPVQGASYDISPLVVKQKLDAGEKFILLDVRQPEEYTQGHLQGAILIPLGELRERYRELNPEQEIITYCYRGGRGNSAAMILLNLGFGNVKNMKGGISAWPYAVVK